MKYYFKSPEELKESIDAKKIKSSSPFRNRTFLMVFADIALFLIVFYILYYSGILFSIHNRESKVYKYNNLDISGVLAEAKGQHEPDLLYYLRIKNTGKKPLLFPEAGGLYDCSRSKFRIMSQNTTVFEYETLLERRLIDPDKTEIYRSAPAAPELKSYDRKNLNFEFIIECRNQTLNIPLQ